MRTAVALLAGFVLVVWAVLTALTHPTLSGYVCGDFPACQFSALAYPDRVRTLVDGLHFFASASAALACAVFLVHTATRRKQREAARAQGEATPTSYAASLFFLFTLVGGHLALSGQWGLPPHATHFFAMLMAHAAVFCFLVFAFPLEGGLARLKAEPWRGVAFSWVALVSFLGMATALSQFDSGLFLCGDEKSFCAPSVLTGGAGVVTLARTLLQGAVGLVTLSVFLWSAWRIAKWQHRGALLLVPWLSVAWLGTFLFRDADYGPVPAFAVNQLAGWALAFVLFFASRSSFRSSFA
ncbi:MAG: hypothetical protein IOD12_07570 [Silvanigrellales bacterium]|nr:hypothetical protein [Silvanigrellales bacterium]